MRIKEEKRDYRLNAETVDAVSEYMQAFYASVGTEKKQIARLRLTAEELLLEMKEHFGEGAAVTAEITRRFFRRTFVISVAGAPYDPFRTENETRGDYGTSLLRTLGLSPEYSYQGGRNCFAFPIPKKRINPMLSLAIVLIGALAVGFLGMLLPENLRASVLTDLIDPVYNAFLNLLGCAAGPMIFFSVVWGIYGIGDTTTLSRIGKRMILGFVSMLFLILLLAMLALLPFFHLDFAAAAQGGGSAEGIFALLLNVFPENVFSPFVDGNSLQIIFMAFIIGIAMLFLGTKTSAVARAVEQINYIIQFLMEFISKLVPAFIFLVMIRFIWSDTLSVLAGLSKLFLVLLGAILLMAVGLLLFTAWRFRASPAVLLKKGLPTFLIAITTASSAASFSTNVETCEKHYGVDTSVTSFGIPLGMIMFKPATALNFLVFALYFAELYRVPCSVGWLLLAVLVTGILAVATPPIPGGALTAYTIISMQLGIPLEVLSVALMIDVVADFLCTGFNQFSLPFALIRQAQKIGRLDRDCLRRG